MRFSVLCCVENIKVAFCVFFSHTRLFVIANFALTNQLFSHVFLFSMHHNTNIYQYFLLYIFFVCEKPNIFWHKTTNKKINNFSKKHDKRIVFNKRVYHFVWYGKYLNCSTAKIFLRHLVLFICGILWIFESYSCDITIAFNMLVIEMIFTSIRFCIPLNFKKSEIKQNQ